MASKLRPRICVDFDGTIWDGFAVLPGCIEKLRKIQWKYTICIFSARHTDTEKAQMMRILQAGGVPYDEVLVKPDAVAYIDDKAVHFNCWDDVCENY